MKKKLFAIGLIATCSVNLQAMMNQDSLIKKSTLVGTAAVTGYVLGTAISQYSQSSKIITTQTCGFDLVENYNILGMSWNHYIHYYRYRSVENFKFERKQVCAGLVTAAVCSGLVLWAAQK